MERIYRYNPGASYKPNGGRYLQLMSAKDLYIQNITASEHGNHSDSFQVKFPNVFPIYPYGRKKMGDPESIACENSGFKLWQTKLNFVVFCASSACGVSLEHMNAKMPMMRNIYHLLSYQKTIENT